MLKLKNKNKFKRRESGFLLWAHGGFKSPLIYAPTPRKHIRSCKKRPETNRSRTWRKKKKETKKNKKINFYFFAPDQKTRAESHPIDATRHLYRLQYPVLNLSRLQMIHGSSNLALLCAPRKCVWSWPEGYRNFNR